MKNVYLTILSIFVLCLLTCISISCGVKKADQNVWLEYKSDDGYLSKIKVDSSSVSYDIDDQQTDIFVDVTIKNLESQKLPISKDNKFLEIDGEEKIGPVASWVEPWMNPILEREMYLSICQNFDINSGSEKSFRFCYEVNRDLTKSKININWGLYLGSKEGFQYLIKLKPEIL